MRILVVDDDPVCRKIVAKGLEKGGYETVEASGALEALRVLECDFDA